MAKHCQANHGGPNTDRTTRTASAREPSIGSANHITLQRMISATTIRRRRGWRRVSTRNAATLAVPKTARTMATMMATRSTGGHNTPRPMAHFDIPLDIPHAGRIADRLLTLLGRYVEESDAAGAQVTSDRLGQRAGEDPRSLQRP